MTAANTQRKYIFGGGAVLHEVRPYIGGGGGVCGGDAAVFWCFGVTGCGGGGLWVVSFLSFVKEY